MKIYQLRKHIIHDYSYFINAYTIYDSLTKISVPEYGSTFNLSLASSYLGYSPNKGFRVL